MRTDNENMQEQQGSDISVEELQTALKRSHVCKSAGIEHVSNYWLKSFYEVHYILASLLSDTIKNLEDSLSLLSEGIIYLLSKANDKITPQKYIPIICLSTTKYMCSWRLMFYSLLNKNVTEEDPMVVKINCWLVEWLSKIVNQNI